MDDDLKLEHLLGRCGELEERCTELEGRVTDLENNCDSDDIIDVVPDEEGCYCVDDDSVDLPFELYPDTESCEEFGRGCGSEDL